LALLFAVFAATLPAAAQCTYPYVFILVDTSGSMSYSPICTQAQIDAGQCSFLCPTGDCYVPLQGDDPASRIFQVKEALYNVIASHPGVHFGFASYNQDSLRVQSKHWIYQAQGDGPLISGWGPYPATGAQEVFGALWPCDTGSGDNEIGCYPASPADLPDAWELARVQRVPKGGAAFNQSQLLFLRKGTTVYKVLYTPSGTSAPGSPTLSVNVRIDRCTNSNCSSFTLVGQQIVTWSLVNEFLSWDSGTTTFLSRTNPGLQYFSSLANDPLAINLRWPTDISDPRGSAFYTGDMLPFDWLTDHQQDILQRLAPNIATGATVPDFRVSPYLQDQPLAGESFLRLKDESARPLIAMGTTPLGFSIRAFRNWYPAWEAITIPNDPDWSCRRKFLLVITDNPSDDCSNVNACAEAYALRTRYNVKSYAIGYGTPAPQGQPITCIASDGGTGAPYYPQSKQELIDVLNAIFSGAATP
jgi:hypothetical protein